MNKHKVTQMLGLVVAVALLLGGSQLPTFAQTDSPELACEVLYTVQPGDWLSTIAEEYLGDVSAYPALIAATNQMNAGEPGYIPLTAESVIEPGMEICIPSAADAQNYLDAAGEAVYGPQEVILKPGKNTVTYLSEGEKIVAHLYLPEDYVEGEKRPAIVIVPPATGVKEQTAGLYAEKLSHEGFITLAFDPRGFGESEGHEVLLNPYRIADDIRNSVSFISTLEEVDVNNIFNMGICAGAGYSAYATAFDSRVKALAIVSPYLTSSDDRLETFGGSTNLRQMLMPAGAAATQKYYETGEDTRGRMVPETEEEMETATPISVGMMEYYLPGKPGDVPTWRNELSLLSLDEVLSFSIYNFTHMFDAVPVYMVYGDEAISADGAIRFYDALNGPKEQLVVEGAGHFDLYWMPEYVDPAVEGISNFLKAYIQ